MFFSKSFKRQKAIIDQFCKEKQEAELWVSNAWIDNKKAAAKLEHEYHSDAQIKRVQIAKLQAEIENLVERKKLEEANIELRKSAVSENCAIIKEQNDFLKKQNENLLDIIKSMGIELAKKSCSPVTINSTKS